MIGNDPTKKSNKWNSAQAHIALFLLYIQIPCLYKKHFYPSLGGQVYGTIAPWEAKKM
jgi:hypothetical protein